MIKIVSLSLFGESSFPSYDDCAVTDFFDFPSHTFFHYYSLYIPILQLTTTRSWFSFIFYCVRHASEISLNFRNPYRRFCCLILCKACEKSSFLGFGSKFVEYVKTSLCSRFLDHQQSWIHLLSKLLHFGLLDFLTVCNFVVFRSFFFVIPRSINVNVWISDNYYWSKIRVWHGPSPRTHGESEAAALALIDFDFSFCCSFFDMM